jgi:septal ring factor EnvC (AmiA/AmiB activator)
MAEDGPGPATIGFFRQRIRTLEKSERELEIALLKKTEELNSLMISARQASETLTVASDLIDDLRASVDKQRKGWAKESYALAKVIALAPQPIRNALEVIATASRNKLETDHKSSGKGASKPRSNQRVNRLASPS